MRPRTHTADWLDQKHDAIDLRKNLPDERIDTIRRRADWLDEPERSLVLAMFRDGRPATEIAAHAPLADAIVDFWQSADAQQAPTWRGHLDINAVMLATSLLPDEFLAV